jgi:P-type conjugative transfer protein TrbJ
MKKSTQMIAVTALAACVLGSTTANATAIIAATEPTQIINMIQLIGSQLTQIDQLAQQVLTVENQIKQYETMLRNLASLPKTEWAQVTSLINSLRTAESSALGFAYQASSWDTVFQAQHPDFATYQSGGPIASSDYADLYKKWNIENNEAVQKTVTSVGLSKANFDTDSATMETLDGLSDDADGQKEVLQAANKFAKLLNQQILLLRQVIGSQTAMQATFLAQKSEQEAVQTAQTNDGLKSTKNFVTGSEKKY